MKYDKLFIQKAGAVAVLILCAVAAWLVFGNAPPEPSVEGARQLLLNNPTFNSMADTDTLSEGRMASRSTGSPYDIVTFSFEDMNGTLHEAKVLYPGGWAGEKYTNSIAVHIDGEAVP